MNSKNHQAGNFPKKSNYALHPAQDFRSPRKRNPNFFISSTKLINFLNTVATGPSRRCHRQPPVAISTSTLSLARKNFVSFAFSNASSPNVPTPLGPSQHSSWTFPFLREKVELKTCLKCLKRKQKNSFIVVFVLLSKPNGKKSPKSNFHNRPESGQSFPSSVTGGTGWPKTV